MQKVISSYKLTGVISVISLALLGVFPANAQSPATAADRATSDGAETIIVTARKRGERLIDVPVAVSVLDATSLARYSTTNFESVGTQIPQVMLTKSLGASGGGQLTIRGIGSTAAGDDSIEQAVSFNIDGVSSAKGNLITQAMFDLANVQVLKGPQSLYFGKNSPAGVLVVESQGPGDELEGFVKAGYEFKAREYQVEAAIGGPVTDTFGARFAVFRSEMFGGYVKNIAPPRPAATSPILFDQANGLDLPGRSYKWGPGSKQTAGRLTLVFKPAPNFDATVKLLGADYRDNGEFSTFITSSCATGRRAQIDLGAIAFTGSPGVFFDDSEPCGKTRTQSIGAANPTIAATIPKSNGGKPYTHSEGYLASATMNYRTDNITFTSVTGYYLGKRAAFEDYGQISYSIIPASFRSKTNSFSQELRAVTKFSGPLNVSLGAFYARDKKDYAYASGLVRVADPALGLNGNLYSAGGPAFNKGNTLSVFGELSWKIAPELELAGGARYSREKKRTTVYNDYVQPGLVPLLGVTLPQANFATGENILFAKIKENNVSPQVTLSWHPTGNSTVFIGYRTGFKSGGIANPGLLPASATSQSIVFGNEKAKGYEGGVKFSSPSIRLSGDITIYNYNFRGLQVSSFDVPTNTLRITNAAAAESSGVEGTLNYSPTDELSFRGAVGYNRARYSRFGTAPCFGGQTVAEGCVSAFQDLSGQPLVRAPEWSANAGFTYDRPISGDMGIGFNMDVRYTSSYFASSTNSPYSVQDGYALLDASIRLHHVDNRWDLALIGKNLTNTYYWTASTELALAVTPGTQQALLGNPRTVMLQGTFRF